jgi:SAM domain (Sterile alpha motif)
MTSKGATIDVGAWLRDLGLGQYEATFRENAINEKVLPNLTAEDLKDVGIGRGDLPLQSSALFRRISKVSGTVQFLRQLKGRCLNSLDRCILVTRDPFIH